MTDTRQSLAALLPCPFCGNSKGLAVANENPQDLSGGYFIACPSCDASTGLRFACGEDPIPLLIEQWNRRAALSAQPVAGAVAVDETGWLIEHSGEILPGAEQRAQVSWLRVQMKFNGYGAREFGFTHDANEALRFARKEDAEAVLAMHLGASPPDWYSKPFSVTEHMWPAAPQAAPEPEPSAPIDAFKLYAELRDLVAEAGAVDTMIGRPEVLRSRLSALCKRVGQLTTDLPIGTAPAPEPSAQAVAHPSHQTVREWMPVSEALRLSDLWTAGDLDNCGQWRAAIKVLADEVRALAASPQPEPSAQGEPVRQADERGDMAMREWHRECDDADTILRALGLDPVNCRTDGGSLKTGMILDALQARDRILQRAAPSTQPHAVVEAVPLTDEQIERIRLELCDNFILGRLSAQVLARAIERAHGIAPKAAQEKT